MAQSSIEQQIWQASVEEQIARGIPLNPNAGLQQMIIAYPGHYTPVTRERSITIDGIEYGWMAGESVTGEAPRRVWRFKKPWSGAGGVTVFVEPPAQSPEYLPVEPINQRNPLWGDVSMEE